MTIFHEYGALSHARFARVGAPLLRYLEFSYSDLPTIFGGSFQVAFYNQDIADIAQKKKLPKILGIKTKRLLQFLNERTVHLLHFLRTFDRTQLAKVSDETKKFP